MIESFASKLVKAQTKHPKKFLFFFALVTLLLLPGIFLLIQNVEPSLEKVLPPDVEEVRTMNDMRAQFGADMMYILVETTGPVQDIRNPEVLRYLDILAQKLRTREHVLEVRSIADLALTNDERTSIQLLERDPRTAAYLEPTNTLTVMMIRTDTGASAETINKVVRSVEEDIANTETFNPGVTTRLTGFNVIDRTTFNIIIKDFSRITLLSFALVAFLVFMTFRSVKKGMMPLVVVMAALIWMLGIAGYVGLTITVVSMVAAAMIMGLGIDFGIHIVHTYESYRKKKRPKPALEATMRELLRATLAASLTTSAGFLALLFGAMTAMQTLGIILALGIISTLIGAVFLLPVIIYEVQK